MKVSSTVYPESREYLQGKVLVNFNVTSKEKDGTVMYTYEQLKFEPWYSDEAIEKEVAKKKEELKVKSITPRQARLKLLEANLLDNLETVITTNRTWQIEWEYATEVRRDSPLIEAVAVQAGLTSEQIDQMFTEASKL
jgi:hypothetical protein